MSNNEKLLKKAQKLSIHEKMFQCPICSGAMKVERMASLECENRHCYDISRQGYVNLLNQTPRTKYDKALFEARKKISGSGFFGPMVEAVTSRLIQAMKSRESRKSVRLLDAGCGEGSHLSAILRKLREQRMVPDVLGVGMDIAKEGIVTAAKTSPDPIWCVADLSQSPFADQQFDYILNILSPSNYSEFRRLLTSDGMLVKVIPGSMYLQELRALFYTGTGKETYSNDGTMELFIRHFERIEFDELRYRVILDSNQMKQLIHMTPLSWSIPPEVIERMPDGEMEVTADFTLLYGWI
ncbi:methyltransferase domain-containing protein [Paenibacillus sp. p3-SID867]|uniref:putative RNA methyltransferase n=1 Tax=Paenibacillus sp. p3-SID867 TaxID=2916363 RepID=UPI0021A8F240|nr:methyltransferase domain-containing protein [Paenibacillus sp. p3-SID867]MCT1400299.1 methyltransferase domain-containing protein [Paenibacillus sp. p3-SID867]